MVLVHGCPADASGDCEDGDTAAGDVLLGHAWPLQPASVAGAVPLSTPHIQGWPVGSSVVLVAWVWALPPGGLPLGTTACGDSATSSSLHRRPEWGWLGAQRGEVMGLAPLRWLPAVAPCPGAPQQPQPSSCRGVTGVGAGVALGCRRQLAPTCPSSWLGLVSHGGAEGHLGCLLVPGLSVIPLQH